jgi:hypothetical protein
MTLEDRLLLQVVTNRARRSLAYSFIVATGTRGLM